MISSSLKRIKDLLGLELLADSTAQSNIDYTFNGVVHDTRYIKGGELFICLKGAKEHGNNYIKQAFDKGCALCLADANNTLPEVEAEFENRIILAKDTLKSYWLIAKWWRSHFNFPVIAITGSFGKTTTKEILARLLLSVGNGYYSPDSWNNHTGVPASLCNLSNRHNWAVIEIGINHAEEMEGLTKLASPDIAIVTSVGEVHIEFFESVKHIAYAKLDIVKGLKDNGILIYNDKYPLLNEVAEEIKEKFNKINFKKISEIQNNSKYYVALIKSSLISSTINFCYEEQEVMLNTNLLGRHNIENLNISLQVFYESINLIMAFKENLEENFKQKLILYNTSKIEFFTRIIPRIVLPSKRLEKYVSSNGRILINDAYNANPQAMQSLIDYIKDYLKEADEVQDFGLFLGDMLELGDSSEHHHYDLGQKISDLPVSLIVFVGKYRESFYNGLVANSEILKNKVFLFDNIVELENWLIENKEYYLPQILFFKSSNSIGLYKIAEKMLEMNI